MSTDTTYWASTQGLDLAREAYNRVRRYYTDLPNTVMYKRWSKAYRTYYGLAGEDDPFDISKAMQAGTDGQLVSVKFNHAGSIGRRAVALVTQTVPDWDVIPEQSDSVAQEQADFGRKLLDYEMDIGGSGAFLFDTAEGAFIFGECTYALGWDPLAGPKLKTPDAKLPMRTRVGDLTRDVFTPLDLIVDRYRYDRNHQWKIERRWKNKWDLAARYPKYADQIIGLSASTRDKFPGVITNSIEADRQRKSDLTSDLIPLYTLLHEPSDALEPGKIALFLSEDIVLYEGPFPYGDQIPHATIAPGKMIRTPFGDSGLHHILGIQDVLDNVASSIASNNVALATHVIMIPKGAEWDYRELGEGLAALEVDMGPDGKHRPEVLKLNASNEVAQAFVDFAIKSMETNSGIPSTLRGTPQPNIQSGAFAALVSQQALEYAGPFQYSFQQAVAKAGNIIISIFQQYADQPRVVEIAGQDHAYQVKSFSNTGDDQGTMGISKIHRVAVKSGNPASRTPGFAVAAADSLLERGALGPPGDPVVGKRYLQLVRTGDLDTAISSDEASSLLIRRENESFRKGENPPVLAVHRHRQHILEHTASLDGPETLENPKIGSAGLDHIQQHILALRTVDPALLMLIGETPLPPMPGMAPMPTGTPPGPQSPPGHPGAQPGPLPSPPPQNGAGKLPHQPQMPMNPLTQQRASTQDGAIKS